MVGRLLQQEYRVRHAYGDQPSHAQYAQRFPQYGHLLPDALHAVTRSSVGNRYCCSVTQIMLQCNRNACGPPVFL